MTQEALGVTIIGGYLGAGKTTLVNQLLRRAEGLRLAVLVNEFGDLPIDGDLIEKTDGNIINIAGGCVCCSYGNDLVQGLFDIVNYDPHPHHIILEASGVALPGSIAHTIELLESLKSDGIVIVADAETVQKQAVDPFVGDTISRQLDSADIVILNKVDLVSESEQSNITSWLTAEAAQAQIVAASNCVVPLEVVLDANPRSYRINTDNDLKHSSIFTSISFKTEEPVDLDAVAQLLATPDLGLVRAKGFLRSADNSIQTIQIVGRRWQISPSKCDASCKIVCIGVKPKFNAERIHEIFVNCSQQVRQGNF